MPNPFKSEFDILKETGMTPQQIKEALAKSKELEDRTKTFETELATTKTALSEAQSERQQVRARLDEIEANSRRPATPREPKSYTSIVDDEDKAFNERFNDSVQPVAFAAVKAGANAARLEARLSLQGRFITTPGGRVSLEKLWDKWRSEIDKASAEVPSANLINAATWINIFDYIKGKHIEEMMEKPDTFVESVSTRADIKVGDEEIPAKLNDEELATIKKMGRESKNVTAETYAETKKKMKFVNV